MITLRLAIRNLFRNPRRTVITVVGMALGIGIFIFYEAVKDGFWDQAVASAIEGVAGHVVVEAPDWLEKRDPALVVEHGSAVAETLSKTYPQARVLQRIWLNGLLKSAHGSAPVEIQGVQPSHEAAISAPDRQITDGAWLKDADSQGVVIGKLLASVLNVGVGDKVVLMASAGGPDVEAVLLRVRGVSASGSDLVDAVHAVTDLSALQSLLPGQDAVHQVAVIVPKTASSELDPTPARQALAGQGVSVLTWHEAIPMLDRQRELDSQAALVLHGMLGFLIVIGVLNTVLMSVMERLRELGVLGALGMKPRQVQVMVLLEGLGTGLLGAVGGVLVGAIFCWPVQVWGINFEGLMFDASPVPGVAISPVIHGSFSWHVALIVMWIAPFSAMLASLWPARIAARTEPIEAMRRAG